MVVLVAALAEDQVGLADTLVVLVVDSEEDSVAAEALADLAEVSAVATVSVVAHQVAVVPVVAGNTHQIYI